MNPMKKSNKYYISTIAIAGILFLQGANCFASGANDLNSMIKSVEIVEVPKLEDTDKATHSYLDVDFEQGEQYILYRDRGYELELMGLKTEKRLALEPGKYKAVFKFVENGRYYLIVKDAEVKSNSVSKIEVDDSDIETYPLELDEKIDFIAFSQSDYDADKIIPYSTLASELSELKTNLELVDITINDGKSELWLRHPENGFEGLDSSRKIDLKLDFSMTIKGIENQQKGYETEATTPNGYILSYYTYNDTEYAPTISFREIDETTPEKIESEVELAESNTWQHLNLKRKPLDGRAKLSLNVYDSVFPYNIDIENQDIDMKDYYTKVEERIEGEYPDGIKAAIYKVKKEYGRYVYEYQKEYDLKAKRGLILPKQGDGEMYAARLYGQNSDVVYDFMVMDIENKEDLLETRFPKGTTIFMSEDFKEKIDDIAILQDSVDGKIYTFNPRNVSKIVTNFKISPIVELGMKSGEYRYYLSHRADRTYFPMKSIKADISTDQMGVPTKGDLVIGADKMKADQSFLLEAITKNGKVFEPSIDVKYMCEEIDKEESNMSYGDIQFDLGDGKIYFANPLESGDMNIELKYDIENPLFDLIDIGHLKNVIDVDKYKSSQVYPIMVSNKLYDLRLKPEDGTLETAEYKVYNSANEAKSIKIIEKDQKLYLDLGAQDFSDTYTVVIDTLKLKNRTLKNVIFKIKHERN